MCPLFRGSMVVVQTSKSLSQGFLSNQERNLFVNNHWRFTAAHIQVWIYYNSSAGLWSTGNYSTGTSGRCLRTGHCTSGRPGERQLRDFDSASSSKWDWQGECLAVKSTTHYFQSAAEEKVNPNGHLNTCHFAVKQICKKTFEIVKSVATFLQGCPSSKHTVSREAPEHL